MRGLSLVFPPLRPATNDFYTQAALVLLTMTIVSAAALPLYVMVRARVSSVLELAPAVPFDVAIVDLTLADGNGIELIKDIKLAAPAVAIVVLSMHDEALYAERALRAGAQGYVTKRETAKKVVAAIRTELIALVRDQVGPISNFRHVAIVQRLPKTRSGKTLRSTMRRIADAEPFEVPATIDDPVILDEVREALRTLGYAGAER